MFLRSCEKRFGEKRELNSMGQRFGGVRRSSSSVWPQQDFGVSMLSMTVMTLLSLTMESGCVEEAQLSLHPLDLGVLQAVKESLSDLPGGGFFSSWEFSFAADPCVAFSGVQCINVDGFNRVSSLWLGPQTAGSPGLSGTLSPLLGSLNFLSELTISSGYVRGTIPESLGNLQSLQMFSCSGNRLSGSIPSSFVNLRSLQILQLGMNSLDGSVPWEFGQLPALKVLVLSDNKLSGPIPNFFGNALVHLELRNNFFSGGLLMTLPSSLQYLSLKKNCLTGWLGGGLVSLSSLTYLDLSYNQFTGMIPSVLFTFPLSFLLLNHNQLTGQLSVAAPISIGIVDLSYNHLQGPIPSFLSTAQSLFLNNNLLVGAISQDFVSRMEAATLQSLYLQHNYLTDFSSLSTSVLPSNVAFCVQYNCILPPPQSLCPEQLPEIQASRPANQCTTVIRSNSP